MTRRTMKFALILLVIVTAGLSIPAFANSNQYNDSPAQYRASVYLWGAAINGTTSTGQPIDVKFEDIIKHLNLGFMGTVEARKNNWSLLTDVIYLNLKADKASSIPASGTTNINSNANLDLKGFILNLIGGYNIVSTKIVTTDLAFGARFLKLIANTDLRLDAPGRTENATINLSGSAWDGIIGVKGNIKLNSRWLIPYYLDVGTGQSKFTWQAVSGISYGYPWGSVDLVYRYMSWRTKSGKNLRNINFSGPAFGIIYNF